MENQMPFILIKASGMPMVSALEDSIRANGYKIKKIYNLSNGWGIIKQFYLNNKNSEEFNLEVQIHAWLEKYLFGESAYILFVDTDKNKKLEQKCRDVLKIKKDFRNKYTLSRDGTFMIAMDILKTPFKPLLKWKKGRLKVGMYQFDPDIPQEGVFRGYYFKYAHTPDNLTDYRRHMEILKSSNVLTKENEIKPMEWKIIKSAIIGDNKTIKKIIKPNEEELMF